MTELADVAVAPLPTASDVRFGPPTADEVVALSRGVAAVIAGPDGTIRPIQQVLLAATFESMTGHRAVFEASPTALSDLVDTLRDRDAAFRSRIVQQAMLGALVVDPIPVEVADRLARLSELLQVEDAMIGVTAQLANGQFELAAVDFDRNGYTSDWDPTKTATLHASRPIDVPWGEVGEDPALAARWDLLESMPEGSLGLAVSRFYRARGFVYPGRIGSVSPLLAQHDWVHVLADYGATIDNELEVFAFIARANDDPKGFSFLAMVVSLFETGVLQSGAGLFTPDIGHLQLTGMPERVADAMRRGALVHGSVDFLALDWFELATRPLDDLRREFGIVAKSPAISSPGPFERGGINEYQLDQGRAQAEARGTSYETWGASPA